jgi:hypothetical protein
MFSVKDQELEVARLVTLERLRQADEVPHPDDLIAQSLDSDEARRIAMVLYGRLDAASLSPFEKRYLKRVRALAGPEPAPV